MRRSLAKSTIIGHATRRHPLFSSGYSSSAGGRGRGRGSPLPSSDLDNLLVPGSTSRKADEDSKDEAPISPSPGMGHGRGKPFVPSTSNLPSFSSPPSGSPSRTNSSGRGRGSILEPRPREQRELSGPKKPIFFLKEDDDSLPKPPIGANRISNPEGSSSLPSSILNVLLSGGAGRGKPSAPPTAAGEMAKEENRHLRARQPERSGRGRADSPTGTAARAPRLSPEEARKKAMGILSRGGGGGDIAEEDEGRERVGGGRGFRGRGGGIRGGGRGGGFSGRGMQSSWRGRGRGGRGRGRGRGRGQDTGEDDYGSGLYLGDDADGEKLAARIGAENMNKLVEGFEEMSGSVLPSPIEDALVDALHTNYMIECEPEYLMEEFGTNPDIDEKPPIPLRDALEKMKPFLMAYEGIQSQEEWEEVMKETMEQVPLMKEIVDYYSGPDRVTAKRQQEELERVAKTLPDSAPTSVKRFTDRALLSLQSNPGWGFDKKCQFMDKLVWEVSQQYK